MVTDAATGAALVVAATALAALFALLVSTRSIENDLLLAGLGLSLLVTVSGATPPLDPPPVA